MGSTASPKRLRLASRAECRADFHALRPTRFHGDVQNPARLPSSVAPSVITVPRRCRNVRLLRIGYACRPRLSSRTRFHGDVQNPARLPSSVAPSVITVPRRCRNVRLLRIGYACRPRLSSRLTLGGLAFPRNPWAHGGSVSHAALATHASILTSERSTAGRPAASPPSESSPTTEFPRNPWAHGGSVSHAALATHASILTSERSTAGRPAASPPSESSPTTEKVQSAASAPCLAPCIVGACPLDQ